MSGHGYGRDGHGDHADTGGSTTPWAQTLEGRRLTAELLELPARKLQAAAAQIGLAPKLVTLLGTKKEGAKRILVGEWARELLEGLRELEQPQAAKYGAARCRAGGRCGRPAKAERVCMFKASCSDCCEAHACPEPEGRPHGGHDHHDHGQDQEAYA